LHSWCELFSSEKKEANRNIPVGFIVHVKVNFTNNVSWLGDPLA